MSSTTTGIEWTQATWNPVRGCSRKSPGCFNCYAERVAHRFGGPGKPYEGLTRLVNGKPTFTGTLRTVPESLDAPLRWIEGRRIFVNSISDLFHERAPFQFIADVFATMSCTTRHTYQVLTKRPEVMLAWLDWLRSYSGEPLEDMPFTDGKWPEQVDALRVWPTWQPYREGKRGGYDNCGPIWPLENVILGVSIEDQPHADERFPMLVEIARRGWRTMVSLEPLLGPVTIPANYLALGGKAWVIAGGESGPKARPTHPDWIRAVRDQCATAGVPFFFKQWGEWAPVPLTQSISDSTFMAGPAHDCEVWRVGKKAAGRLLDGREHNEFPS